MSDALTSPLPPQRGTTGTTLVRTGGALAIAGCSIGLLVFLVACAGFGAAFEFSPIPAVMGAVGLVLTLVGATQQRSIAIEDTHVVASLFVSLMALAGGLVLMAVWLHWPIFFGS
jgi:hypothetical protein